MKAFWNLLVGRSRAEAHATTASRRSAILLLRRRLAAPAGGDAAPALWQASGALSMSRRPGRCPKGSAVAAPTPHVARKSLAEKN